MAYFTSGPGGSKAGQGHSSKIKVTVDFCSNRRNKAIDPMHKWLPIKSSFVCVLIDLFTDTAAILNSIVSNSYYGMLRGQISMYLPPEHPIIGI